MSLLAIEIELEAKNKDKILENYNKLEGPITIHKEEKVTLLLVLVLVVGKRELRAAALLLNTYFDLLQKKYH